MNNQKLQEWISWIDHINPEIYYLLNNRKVFRLLVKEHNAGKMVDLPLWSFIKSNYAGNMTIAICRQVDTDYRSITLLSLLENLLKNADMITKKWFIDDYPWATKERFFIQLFGDKDIIDIDNLKKNIKNLKGLTDAIRYHRNKRIAHSDSDQQIPKEPVFEEIDLCVDILEELSNQCYFLLKQSTHHFDISENKVDFGKNKD